MIAEKHSNLIIDEPHAEFGAVSVLLPIRRTDRSAYVNGDAGNGREVFAETTDRTSSDQSSVDQSELKLAGMPLADLERLAIIQTLQSFDGNRTKSARVLGISVRTLQRKLRKWGIAENSSVPGATVRARQGVASANGNTAPR